MEVAHVISNTVQWIIVPSIILALFIFALIVARSVTDSEQKASAWAGFWAGLVVFVIYVVSQLNSLHKLDFKFSTLPGLLLAPLLLGFVVGFIFIWLVKAVIPTRVVGFITLLLTASSTSALFTYIFINSLRASVLYGALGTALGILLHIILFPASVRDMFSRK